MEYGKTSLIRKIIDEDKGITLNPALKFAYFRQNLNNLNPNKTILENVTEDTIQDETTVRNVLGNLNIKNEEVYKRVSNISGGEKVKASLAKVILSNTNMLILDEPTNFLDIEGIEALEKMLKSYCGTVLIVSHDKDFVNSIADNVIIIKNSELIEQEGNYSSYLEREKEKAKSSNKSNEKLLLQFKLAKLEAEISTTKDEAKKQELIKEYEKLKEK